MNGKGTTSDVPVERISGSVERVTFHSEESGFCVLRIKVKGKRELVTVIGSAQIGDRELVQEAVPAEDKMQAFLWRHKPTLLQWWHDDDLPRAQARP